MPEGQSKYSPSVSPAGTRTHLAPLLIYCAFLLASWTVWAVFVSPRTPSLRLYQGTVLGVLSRLIFWGIPTAIYLHRYWGRRALELLGLTFPMGAPQGLRTLLITAVVALCLIAGTAAQAGHEWTLLLAQLVAARSVDWSAPILEELVFRGVIVSELLNWTHDSSHTPVELRLKFWGGQLGAALIFVAVHWPYWVSHGGLSRAFSLSLPVFVTGLILGFVFATTRSIWGCIALHGLNNALSQLT